MTGERSQRHRDHETASRSISCSSGKWSYTSRRVAKLWAQRARSVGKGVMRPYECNECGAWHVGHKPRAVIRGDLTAAEWYEGTTEPEPTGSRPT